MEDKKKGLGLISRIRKFIDSNKEIIGLLLAYILSIGLLLWWSVNVSL
jgi:hypothetical protein